ncbi:hypothetical protein AZH53_02745 [Methanomicrobiaceae archaeon CYW5]|nr:hypothetical protein [Methanovulcanius yangii]
MILIHGPVRGPEQMPFILRTCVYPWCLKVVADGRMSFDDVVDGKTLWCIQRRKPELAFSEQLV